MHGVPSAAIIGSNYVRYDAETSPDASIWKHSPRINSPWIILMTTSHSCVNTRGMMYDSSVLVWSNEWLTGNYGDWVQVPFVKNLAQWPPTNRWTYCCPIDDTVLEQLPVISNLYADFLPKPF